MKSIKKLFAMGLAVMMALSIPFSVSAAELEDAPIDESRTGSLTIYKYDLTNAEKDGVWDSSYVSTGVFDQAGVNDVLGGSGAALGNGETGYGYAIKGVEFSYLKVADIVTFSESENDSRTDSHVEILYAIDKTKGADFLKALNLADGAQRYANADALDEAKYFYQSDVLIDALAAALESNSTVVKNALEAYISANGGAAMPLTDAYGKTKSENLNLGLYLIVETKVPEMVVSTTDPFLVSVPMTSVNGTNATDGGTRWIYDITLYPKNLTGIPSLEKTLRENKNDTGKHNGSATITDGFAHTGTASAGDTIDYQIISTLPSITSESTYPLISNYVNQKYASTIYTKYEEMIQNVDETELQEARRLAEAYNEALAPVSSYDKEGISEASHNYDSLLNLGGNGIMGYIEIPCIQVNLPIYHGTDTESLERGVGHLLGSSLPVGGSGTHAVLSGHSGMAGQKMFTDLLQMKTGDIFYLHVLGETLAYEVDSLNTVLPHDTSLLGITDGSDLCTLITCTPIAVNSHRLLVTGHRIPFEAAREIVEEAQQEDTEVESAWEQEYLRGLYIAIAIVLILFLICIVVALPSMKYR